MHRVTLSLQIFRPRLAAAPATRAIATAVNPATRPFTTALGSLRYPPVVAPMMDIMMNPGWRNIAPLSRPPKVPRFTTPMAKAIWVEVGPGMHCLCGESEAGDREKGRSARRWRGRSRGRGGWVWWGTYPSARNSVNTLDESQFFLSTKTCSKVAMCAAGPPKAVHPRTANCLKIVRYPTWVNPPRGIPFVPGCVSSSSRVKTSDDVKPCPPSRSSSSLTASAIAEAGDPAYAPACAPDSLR